jgi:hypothetical protein
VVASEEQAHRSQNLITENNHHVGDMVNLLDSDSR